jgi:hypothetical protein
MVFWKRASRPAEERHKPVTCVDRADGRARLIGSARSVHFARGDTSDPDLYPVLGAPDWPVAVVNGNWSAGERLARRDDFCRRRLLRRDKQTR